MKSKKEEQEFVLPEAHKVMVLDAYFEEADDKRFTSQDVCDNLRETLSLVPDEVTAYMLGKGCRLCREDDRLVWTAQ